MRTDDDPTDIQVGEIMQDVTLDGSVIDKPVEDVKITKLTFMDFVKDICEGKQYLLNEQTTYAYVPFMVNRALSHGVDTIMWANEMNKFRHGTPDMLHDFLFYSIPKKKRYNKWAKANTDQNDQVELLMKHYSVNRRVALSYLALLTEQQMDDIKLRHNTGGKSNVRGR